MQRIFHLDENQKLISLDHQPYDSEDLLQRLLAQYPDILTGEAPNGDSRRWLLVSREMPVPDSSDAVYGRWSLDHLFLDQDAIPTLVEVKRSSDSRIRREVVGQMLDYASNAAVYWKVNEIRARFEAQFAEGESADVLFRQLGIESEDGFWERVDTNLRASRIRLVFVADEIPEELRRIVEFLNEQMSSVEVLAVAVRQYIGGNLRTLVPSVYGGSKRGQSTGRSYSTNQWSEDSFFAALADRKGERAAEIGKRILAWSNENAFKIWYGRGIHDGSCFPELIVNGDKHLSFSMWTYGSIEIQFQHMNRPPFNSIELRNELRLRLNQIPGVEIVEEKLATRPTFPITVLGDEPSLTVFLKTMNWFVETVRLHYRAHDSS